MLRHLFQKNLTKGITFIRTLKLNPYKYTPVPFIATIPRLVQTANIKPLTSIINPNPDRPKFEILIDKATEHNENGMIDLLNTLKECIVETSKQYRDCLTTQIQITETATELGPMASQWDDLPEFRLLAAELNQMLCEYEVIIKTVGQIVDDASTIHLISDNQDYTKVINDKYNELAQILRVEFEMNRKIELSLLKLKQDSILKSQ